MELAIAKPVGVVCLKLVTATYPVNRVTSHTNLQDCIISIILI